MLKLNVHMNNASRWANVIQRSGVGVAWIFLITELTKT